METRIQNAKDALAYVQGGRGKFTIVSQKTGTRFTFKESQPDNGLIFVKLLTGSCNQSDFRYIGYIKPKSIILNAGRKGLPDAPGFKALNWVMRQLAKGKMPEGLEFWHSGSCGRCGRELTVPESIATGLGPICAQKT